jgi:hypothetical protein
MSALYRQHHDVEAPRVDARHFRQAWRVPHPARWAAADRAITAAECSAAADYRELWDRVSRAALIRSPIGRASMGTAGHHAFDISLASELDALARLREVRRVLGAWPYTLLYLSVVRDQSWAALGRHYRCDPKTARAWVIAAIKALRTV